MASGIEACEITLPGYTLVDRIGMGGYAEVWRAEAPGGIYKAVKIVYGYYDGEFASQELKSLERVKGVRHSFLLSLERFEIISGRLIILTELADMSLEQRYRQCRAEGLVGIPREELLRYMSDAAEALDFLSQRHNLLHLDIKPENLLILGDHIKVADFGLVKELATRTQNSLVSGMTPTYASPEMFDDEPSAQSDQYSLAIVYQEMLLGTLPFPGRTPAQLAKQHTQAEPQLASLSIEDRPVLARALAKSPEDRYPTCRAFVDALRNPVVTTSGVPSPLDLPRQKPALPALSLPGQDDTRLQSIHTTLRRPESEVSDRPVVKATQVVQRGTFAPEIPQEARAVSETVREETVDIPVPAINSLLSRAQPALYIAIGGTGIQVLCRLRALLGALPASAEISETVETIALDTDRDDLRDAHTGRWATTLSPDDTLHLPLRLPHDYENSREIFGWLSRRWLYNIPRSLETRGYRSLGRLALVDHSPRVLSLIEQKLHKLAHTVGTTTVGGQTCDPTARVVLLAGMGGGTGAGMCIDVANAVRGLAAKRELNVEVQGMLICNFLASHNLSPLAAANTYSLLMELNHASARGNESNSEQASRNQCFESQRAPFDSVYCVPMTTRSSDSYTTNALDNAARYLALEASLESRAAIRSCRVSPPSDEEVSNRSLSIRTFGYASLADQKHQVVNQLAIELRDAIKHYWIAQDNSANWEQLVAEAQAAANMAALSTAASGEQGIEPSPEPPRDAPLLSLRAKFKAHKSTEFASEVLRQIQQRLEARDDRGKPLLLPTEAKWVAEAAANIAASFAERVNTQSANGARFAESSALCSLIAKGSQRIVGRAVEHFDKRRPELFLPIDAIDELVLAECRSLLEECLPSPEYSAALAQLCEFDKMLTRTIESASTNLLQCGCERRTFLIEPKESHHSAAAEVLRSIRPLAVSMTADVDDVVVLSEAAGISPRSLALRLERVFPGIADAARRLLTRIDIDWQRLS